MTNEELLREINTLLPEGQRIIESFLAFLQQRYARSAVSSSSTFLLDEKFIGMWRDRDELTDSTAWVRRIRESEWGQ